MHMGPGDLTQVIHQFVSITDSSPYLPQIVHFYILIMYMLQGFPIAF